MANTHFGPQPPLTIGILNGYDDRVATEPFIFGINGGVGAGNTEGVWPVSTAFNFPLAAGEAMTIVSSSPNDTAAGTGAHTVMVVGLSPTLAIQTTTATMNGVAAVALAGTWRRLLFIQTLTTGTGLVNAGDITVQNGGATVFERMNASHNRSSSCRYTIPLGKTGFVHSWGWSMDLDTLSNLATDLDRRFWLMGTVNQFSGATITPAGLMDEMIIGQNYSDGRVFSSPRRLQAGADIFVNCQNNGGGNVRVASYINIDLDDA